ncbi:uncharacterized protein [Linepithema humile]|uniref:uncharacterized protein isoform X2 n=1 Tax=Linepithema humile TaxID=83485 RepID=UPI00351DD9F1
MRTQTNARKLWLVCFDRCVDFYIIAGCRYIGKLPLGRLSIHLTKDPSHYPRSSANTSAIQSETPGGWTSCGKCLDEMRLMQRLAISGLLSVVLILLLTGTLVTRRDLASVIVDRGVAPEERSEQVNPAWMQDNVVPGQDESEIQNKDNDKDRRLDKHKQSEFSAVGPPAASTPGIYVIRSPNPPLDDVTNQRREKVKEMMKHGWDNYVRYAWGKNELRPISKRGHSASIFGASNMGATIVDGLDTLYIMGLHDEFKQGRDWIAENLDFDIVSVQRVYYRSVGAGYFRGE